jgi:hypothetical protein
MKQILAIAQACCMAITAFAQSNNTDTSSGKILPSQWIEPMGRYFQLKLAQTTDIEKLAVVAAGNSGGSQYISPNAASATRIEFSYKFLRIGYNFIPKFLPGNDDDDIKGKTKGSGLNLGLYFSKWQQELAYGTTTGYYLENTKDYVPGWQEGDPYFQLPNMKFTNIEGLTAYKFNPNYTLKAVVMQADRQLRSAGTFMPALLYRYYALDDKTPLTSTNTTFKSTNFELLAGIGYYYSFVLKTKFYLSLGAMPAAGFIATTYQVRTAAQTNETREDNFIFRFDARAGFGYNGERFFTGMYLRGFGAFNKQYSGSTAINSDSRLVAQVFLGYRLNAPKWLKKGVDKAAQVIPGG